MLAAHVSTFAQLGQNYLLSLALPDQVALELRECSYYAQEQM